MNQLDEFFKEKLKDHSVRPGADAWSRVEAGLSKKNDTWKTWLRAASVLLLLGLSAVIWKMNTHEPVSTSQPVLTKATTPDEVKADVKTTQPEAQVQQEKETPKPPEKAKRERLTSPKVKQQLAHHEEPLPAEPEEQQTEESSVNQTPVSETTLIAQSPAADANNLAQPSEAPQVAAETSITLVYTLELPSANASAEKKEKKTGLRKVLELAAEARTADNPLGGLRQAKDELLAFDFGKEKERRNNNK